MYRYDALRDATGVAATRFLEPGETITAVIPGRRRIGVITVVLAAALVAGATALMWIARLPIIVPFLALALVTSVDRGRAIVVTDRRLLVLRMSLLGFAIGTYGRYKVFVRGTPRVHDRRTLLGPAHGLGYHRIRLDGETILVGRPFFGDIERADIATGLHPQNWT